jgi:hypothetical protein
VSFVAKLFVIFNFVLSIVFLIFAANVWTAQTKWRKMYEDEKTKHVVALAQLQKEDVKLYQEVVRQQQMVRQRESDISKLMLEKGQLRDAAIALEGKITQLENAKDLSDAERQEVAREKQRYCDELVKLKGVLVKQQQAVVVERDNATRAMRAEADASNELNITKQTLAAIQRDKKIVEDDLAQTTDRIQKLLERGVPVFKLLNEDPAATQVAVPDAQVLAVRPDIGLVMISAGSQHNVKPGYQFTISRGDQYISKVQVDKVYPDMCSARVLADMQKVGAEIQVHDEARSR